MSIQEFDYLLVQNYGFLKPIAISLTRDTDNANNLVQETLYKALSNREKYQSGTNIRAWLSIIMRNTFINEYRRRSISRKIFANTSADSYAGISERLVSNYAESGINVKEIKKEIARLPEIFRLPFLLHLEGYRYDEIAGKMNEPLGTIKSRIHFARKLLKTKLTKL
jgi:RNA polymerase sigma-70 factor (ECF subfamily)